MIITLGGRCGAGKSTVGKLLIKELGYEFISIGSIKRDLAQEMGITISEFDALGWNDPDKAREFDLKYEEYQQSLDFHANIVLDSRLGFYCQPNALKVFLTVDDYEGARRVYVDQRDHDEKGSIESVLEVNTKRHQGLQENYKKLYNVDIYDMSNYDMVLDSTFKSPQEIAGEIVARVSTL